MAVKNRMYLRYHVRDRRCHHVLDDRALGAALMGCIETSVGVILDGEKNRYQVCSEGLLGIEETVMVYIVVDL